MLNLQPDCVIYKINFIFKSKQHKMKKLLFVLITLTLAFSSCDKQDLADSPDEPQAAFSTNIAVGHDPLEFEAIQLTNTSTDKVTYAWDFGNGTTSTEKTPSLSYNIHGIYKVKLTVTNSQGLKTSTSQDVNILCRFKNGDHTAALPL